MFHSCTSRLLPLVSDMPHIQLLSFHFVLHLYLLWYSLLQTNGQILQLTVVGAEEKQCQGHLEDCEYPNHTQTTSRSVIKHPTLKQETLSAKQNLNPHLPKPRLLATYSMRHRTQSSLECLSINNPSSGDKYLLCAFGKTQACVQFYSSISIFPKI